MPLFPFRVNISKLQEQDVMKKFTACTFPQDIIASSRWSAIHVHAHRHTQTHTLNRQRYQRLTKVFTKACKKPGLKKGRGMNQSASQLKREGRLRCPQHVLQGPHSSYHRTAEKLESSLLNLALTEMKPFTHILIYLDFQGPIISPLFFDIKDSEGTYCSPC